MISLTLQSLEIVVSADGSDVVQLSFGDGNILTVPIADAVGLKVGDVFTAGPQEVATVTVADSAETSQPAPEPPVAPNASVTADHTQPDPNAAPQPPFRPGP